MLSDPDLPMLPLPTANLVTRPPFKYFGGHHPLTHPAPVMRGNLHLWLSPDPGAVSAACSENRPLVAAAPELVDKFYPG